MDDGNYEFPRRLSKDEKADLSTAMRDLVYRGRIMMAVERYRQGKVSLGRAAELAGVPVGEMMDILASYGIKSNLEREDSAQGLGYLRKVL
ncbi:MAG: UPF0175 family protein [Acidobacteria bacterium]|nr:UPF0175 family protein [Acidobacteriota bacterium]